MKIYKHQLESLYQEGLNKDRVFQVNLPINSQILKIDFVEDHLFLWALISVSPNHYTKKTFMLLKTEDQLTPWLEFEYISTIKKNSEDFFWHVFEEKSSPAVQQEGLKKIKAACQAVCEKIANEFEPHIST